METTQVEDADAGMEVTKEVVIGPNAKLKNAQQRAQSPQNRNPKCWKLSANNRMVLDGSTR